jgi:LPXTG-motif cell wall-anchored protein
MKPMSNRIAAAALAAASMVVLSPAVQAQSPAQVTITFRLTLTGTVPSHDIFLVTFPSNGAQLCGPCVGGHTYEVKIPWAKGSEVVSFKFDRETLLGCAPIGQGSVSCPPSGQHIFAQVSVRPTADQTINAFFTYGNAAVANPSVPATGAGTELLAGAGLIASGAGLLGIGIRRRKRI